MNSFLIKSFAACLCAAMIACSATRRAQNDAAPAASDGAVFVVRGSEMSGNLLDALRARVPNMSVAMQSTGCPLLFFRGPRSVRNAGNATVYVDRTQMADTCILQQIGAYDVERVEVYPSGNVSIPGIQRNANGIIMVYRIRE